MHSSPTRSWVWQARRIASYVFIGFDNVFISIDYFFFDCLNRVVNFVFAYTVLAKPEYAFVLNVCLVLAKLPRS
jgi:hypothetical protein